MSASALAVLARASLLTTFGTTSVARRPMMTITTISSASVKPARETLCCGFMAGSRSSVDVSDLQDGQDDGPDDEADHHGEEDDHDGLEHGGDALGEDLGLF